MIDVLGLILVLVGVSFFLAGSVALLRLPDLLSRLHALTKADNLGLGLLAAGLWLLDGGLSTGLKLFLVWLLVLAGSAASAHLIAKQSLREERY